ncbi:VOC family protein [Cellulomonas sp. P5_C5]
MPPVQVKLLVAGLLAAGATELLGPHETEGMPRSSAVRDPDANVVWLYQG